MDTDRFVEFLSTIVIVGMIAVLAVPRFGVTGLEDRLLTSAAVAIVAGGPFAVLVVYVFDVDSSHLGPWGPEDVVFVAAVAPPVAATVWAADAVGLSGTLYGVAVLAGAILSIGFAVVVRDATVGEWPPGSGAERRREAQQPSKD
ncbi:hypothetical protein L593_13950 [Salinarchaeum sp. Harcht-Bsk1]|uniref:hypothetical protein n=1 Tax=Salinarchaeum sp. Harcht-Bsk1 TaxID=1333523 RepID=UPI00034241ED|nr:hypothetical protein [Salinarchaeum sp. Harcht-Bsk1]AGN02729.1 hypothetical protein L593_13950 [Salinarchaeum sp. Harcht-Bsk1]